MLLTHLHYDHTGWLATDGRPTFAERDGALRRRPTSPGSAMRPKGLSARLLPARIGPLGDRLSTFSADGPVLPGIDALLAPGHTPGSTMFVISEGERRVVLIGDVVHCPVELIEDEWAAIGDVDPILAARTRERVSREVDGAEIGGAHFPGLTLGRLITTSVARRWTVP